MQTSEREATQGASIDFVGSAKYEKDLKRYVKDKVLPYRFLQHGKIKKLPKTVGFIGEWGSGKSLSMSAMTILDHLIEGKQVWSNMSIHFSVMVGNWVVWYSTQAIEKADLLKLQLENGLLVIDEPNIEFAEARRSMSNRNLQFDKVLQMLRKRKLSMLYSVISELWVETRLREVTSMFIKCKDLLLEPGNLGLPFDFGEKVRWRGYDNVGLMGSGRIMPPMPPAFDRVMNAQQFWNCYDTDLVQGEGQSKYGQDDIDATMTVTEPAYITEGKAIQKCLDDYDGLTLLEIQDIASTNGWTKAAVKSVLKKTWEWDNAQKMYVAPAPLLVD